MDAVGVTSDTLCPNQDEENKPSVHRMSSGLLVSHNSTYCAAERVMVINALPSCLTNIELALD